MNIRRLTTEALEAQGKFKCSRCKKFFERRQVHKSSSRKQYQYWRCRKCEKDRIHAYYHSPKGNKIMRGAAKRSARKHADRANARALLNYHVAKGNVVKPKSCSECGGKKNIQCHHEDYTKPLVCIWLCRTCHWDVERMLSLKGEANISKKTK